jgi:hypothetical protein
MKFKIEIEVEEQKDGSFEAKLLDVNLGDIGSINPEDELDKVSYIIQVLRLLEKIDFLQEYRPKIEKELKNSIRQTLAKLLAYYYVDA